MNRSVICLILGIGCVVEGFAKTIPPLIEVGAALLIIAMIWKPKTEA